MEAKIRHENVGAIVRFLVHDKRVPRTDILMKIALAVRSAKIGVAEEYFIAVAKVIHLAREMVALERADAAYVAMGRALQKPARAVSAPAKPTQPKAALVEHGDQLELAL
jgi:hypothetical protein